MILSVVDGVLECKQSVSTNQQITAKQWLVFRDTRKYLNSPGAEDRQSKIKIAFFAMKHFENFNFFLGRIMDNSSTIATRYNA